MSLDKSKTTRSEDEQLVWDALDWLYQSEGITEHGKSMVIKVEEAFRRLMLGNTVWQPIKTMPKDHRHILVFHAPSKMITGAFMDDCGIWRDQTGDQLHEPTHWMPLPEMPQ